MRRQAKRSVEDDVVHLAVALPKGAVDVVVLVVVVWAVQVNQVPAEETGHEDNAAKG